MKICNQAGCSKKFYAKGVCEMHYKRYQRSGGYAKVVQTGAHNPNHKHGMHGTKIYRAWRGMHDRCNPNYKNKNTYYRKEKITVCTEWGSFEAFYADMGETYKEGLTLERIDNSLGYSKDNCRWATMREQSRNKRNNVWVNYKGETMVLKDLARKIGMNPVTMYQRVRRYGYSIDDAVNKPIKRGAFIEKKDE